MAGWALVSSEKHAKASEERPADAPTRVERAARALLARGVVVGGVVQRAVVHEGERAGYQASRLGTGEAVVVGRRGKAPATARPQAVREFCSFVFDDDAFASARAWIEADAARAEVVIIDEVSKLEVARGGHHDAVRTALDGRALVVLGVRADQLFSVVDRFELGDPIATLDGDDDDAIAAFADAVAEARQSTAGVPGTLA